MRRSGRSSSCSPRPGKVLVLVGLTLPALLGMLGLVVDWGLVMAGHRQAQNAADGAALAAAMSKLRNPSADPTAVANTFVQQYNGLGTAADALVLGTNLLIPPATGPYAGNSRYVEVVVTYRVSTTFIQVLGFGATQTVQARAVAGYEAVAAGEGVGVLDPTARPGLSVTGGATLVVNGRVIVNSEGGGLDEDGNDVGNGNSHTAASVANNSLLKAPIIDVVGGVNDPANFQPLNEGELDPLRTRRPPEPDPLIELPTPTTGNGVLDRNLGNPSVSNGGIPNGLVSPNSYDNGTGVTTLYPGIYESIRIQGGTVQFQPGIYVFRPPSSGNITNTFSITGGTITGSEVMFYNTGSDYVASSGAPDSGDAATYNPGPSGVNAPPPLSDNFQKKFGGIQINSATVTFTPPTSGVFQGMLFSQRRANRQTIKIAGNAKKGQQDPGQTGVLDLLGTLYAKWAAFDIAGGGTYDAQFIAGSMLISGQAQITINYAGDAVGKANQVFLVE